MNFSIESLALVKVNFLVWLFKNNLDRILKGLKMKSVVLGEKRIVPTKIVCIGRNYVEHIHELGNDIPDDMVVFLKPN